MDCLIIGGGIGGLALALSLHRMRFTGRVRIFEAASEIRPLGVGINLGPHAVRELAALGLLERIRRVAVEPHEYCCFTQHGQCAYREPWGVAAGHEWPHLSIHRAELHRLLLDAVVDRLGRDCFFTKHRCVAVEQNGETAFAHFVGPDGSPIGSHTAELIVGADGIHSAVRAAFYPNEGPPRFKGINLWRGVTRRKPFLGGASIARIGTARTVLMVYPILHNADDQGNQLINWIAELETERQEKADWCKPGRLDDFYQQFQSWSFDWLDAAELIRSADFILSYPMVDRDPIERWSFGRVTLLGDAAHPMYPRGGNGAAQAIIDAQTLANFLVADSEPVGALKAYEAARLSKANRIVIQTRSASPNLILEVVERRTGGKPFARLEDVISESELRDIMANYQRTVGAHVDNLRGGAA